MPTFDPQSPLSEEVAAIYHARDLLSQLPAVQEILGTTGDPVATLPLIIPGPIDPPRDGQTFAVADLQNQPAWAQIHPLLDEDSLLVTRSRAVAAVSEKEGLFRFHLHYQVRQLDLHQDGGRQNIYLWFLDRSSRVCEEFVELADLNLASHQIKRRKGPLFNPLADQPTQGTFLWADFLIAWGGSEHAE